MTSYTERSKASRKGKAAQYSFHVAKVLNGKEPLILHSYKTLKTATKECEKSNALAESFFAHEGIAPYYHYVLVVD